MLGAAPDHDFSAHGGAGLGEVASVIESALLDRRIGIGEVEAFGFCEQPVETDHFKAVVADDGAVFFRLGGGEFFWIL